jgi:transcriptional regulator with XRE-family HTH domain
MAEQSLIVAELKRALRERGLTYAAVATKLSLSVASVKRLFSSGDLSLKRVDQVCELLETGLADILAQARDRPSANQLTLAQEQEIVADPKLFLIAWLLLNRAPLEDIVRRYKFTEREVLRLFYKLD